MLTMCRSCKGTEDTMVNKTHISYSRNLHSIIVVSIVVSIFVYCEGYLH